MPPPKKSGSNPLQYPVASVSMDDIECVVVSGGNSEVPSRRNSLGPGEKPPALDPAGSMVDLLLRGEPRIERHSGFAPPYRAFLSPGLPQNYKPMDDVNTLVKIFTEEFKQELNPADLRPIEQIYSEMGHAQMSEQHTGLAMGLSAILQVQGGKDTLYPIDLLISTLEDKHGTRRKLAEEAKEPYARLQSWLDLDAQKSRLPQRNSNQTPSVQTQAPHFSAVVPPTLPLQEGQKKGTYSPPQGRSPR